MAKKLIGFVKSMKWYEWLLTVESLLIYLPFVITSRGNFPSTWGYVIGLVLMAGMVFLVFAVPAIAARRYRSKGSKGVATALIVLSFLGIGLALLLLLGIGKILGTGSSGSVSHSYQSSYFSTQKSCSICGRSAPSTAKAGDVCAHCGARWVTEKTSYSSNNSIHR